MPDSPSIAPPVSVPPVMREAGALIAVRARASDGMPEILMAQRANAMRFAGGAMVFPGGAVDDRDRAYAAVLGCGNSAVDVADSASRIAAVRETAEESGLILSKQATGLSVDQLSISRQALHNGQGLEEVARQYGLDFDFAALVPFTRWCPRSPEIRTKYDTRFYIAVVEGEDGDLTPDGDETEALTWTTAADMLTQADAGQAKIIFPTRCNLERLAQFGDVQSLIDHAQAHDVGLISPWREMREGVEYLCINGGLGYPRTQWPAAGMMRG